MRWNYFFRLDTKQSKYHELNQISVGYGCDQIHKINWHEFDHTGMTLMFNKPTSWIAYSVFFHLHCKGLLESC